MGLIFYFLLKNKEKLGGLLTGIVPTVGGGSTTTNVNDSGSGTDTGNSSGGSNTTNTTTTGTSVKLVSGSVGSCSGHIYPVVSAKSGGAGKNQNIHYASTGKAAISHRVDVQIGNHEALEATIYITMPVTCSDGGKNGVGIKFWGPNHQGSACCYCTAGIGPSGNIHFGGEGPHPQTNSNQGPTVNVGAVGGKKIGFKHVIYKKGATIHQEAYVDLGSGWRKASQYDRSTCGFNKTSTSPASNAEVEFRADCANVVYHCTEVAIITPPGGSGTTTGTTTKSAYVRRIIKRKVYHVVNIPNSILMEGMCS